MFKSIFTAAIIISTVSCGSGKSVREDNLAKLKKGIIGEWQTECITPSQALGNEDEVSILRKYTFNTDETFVKKQLVFSYADCPQENLYSALTIEGPYSIEATDADDVFGFNRVGKITQSTRTGTTEYDRESSADQNLIRLDGNTLTFGSSGRNDFEEGLTYRRWF